MTTKTFKKKLIKIIEQEGSFITWDNTDIDFSSMGDDDLIICGEDEKEIFVFTIVKV